MFEGRNIGISSSLAMYITMNPMYDYRNVLPSNLKVRPKGCSAKSPWGRVPSCPADCMQHRATCVQKPHQH